MINSAHAVTNSGSAQLGDFVFPIIVILVLYLIPWFIAKYRGHHQSLAIFWVNLLLGWSGIVWIGCFIWACLQTQKQRMTAERNPT